MGAGPSRPPHGVCTPSEERTINPLLSTDVQLDVRVSRESADSFHGVDESELSSPMSRRPEVPVRVHSRPQVALVTPPSPQTCVLEPVTSSGGVRTTNLVRNTSSRTTSGSLRRNVSESTGSFPSMSSSTSTLPLTPHVTRRRIESVSTSRLQSTNPSSTTRGRSGTGNVNTPIEAVSLTLPRPETERRSNEYVETPLRSGISLIEPKLKSPRIGANEVFADILIGGPETRGTDPNFSIMPLPPIPDFERKYKQAAAARASQRQEAEKVVTSQPTTFKKDRYHTDSACSRQNDDIICSNCNRCRCEACRTPRPLPSTWLCETCLCSADSVVDYITCMCCAKAFLYHCSDEDEETISYHPCSCRSDMFFTRWGCLGLMSIFFPCIFCYWPCRGLVKICECCHHCFTNRGCRCPRPHPPRSIPMQTFEKRLLESHE